MSSCQIFGGLSSSGRNLTWADGSIIIPYGLNISYESFQNLTENYCKRLAKISKAAHPLRLGGGQNFTDKTSSIEQIYHDFSRKDEKKSLAINYRFSRMSYLYDAF